MSEPMDTQPSDGKPDRESAVANDQPPRWSSETILQGQREAIIVHGGDEYRLRWTRNDKLILYK